MKSRTNFSFLFFISLVLISNSLHLDQSQSTQLRDLKSKQSLIGSRVKGLLQTSASVNDQVLNAANDKQRVQILEKALMTQRQQVFDSKNKVIYPFNQSETACSQLTDKQKISILDRIEESKTQLKTLQQINNKLDQNIVKVQNIDQNIQKEYIQLQQMEQILKVKCKQNLSPTIFQSNLNAKNWILGPQTMNDLEQQYAQRALIFHTITNCPFQTPFYSISLQVCIKCEQPNPVFNMYSKQCTKCQGDEELDSDKKICKSRPHYTNFTKVKNWNLDQGNMPQINKNLTPCTDSKPYFNGIICIACDLPYYWSVSANLCQQCQKGLTFDLNTKKCQKVDKFQLTILQNTKWVSANLTKTVQDRIKILQKNKTSGNYRYCPNPMNPFDDGTTCIFCEFFNMETLKCVQKPNGTQYDYNMKRFLLPEENKQTNPAAKRYITQNKLTDSSIPNCNQTFPYYDGIACVQCLKPFEIFNLDQRKCVSCNANQIYVQNLHICQSRKKIKVSDNFNKLLATSKVTVPKYKESLIKSINDSPDAIIYPCSQKNQYSNSTDCFPCQESEYFNVQTLKCEVCDGIYFDNNQTCKAKVYIFINLKAPKIVDMDGTTVQNQNNKISEFLKVHPQSYVCPIDKPYAIQNKTCGICPDLFSYSEFKCKSCPEWNIYVADMRKCQQAKMLVNFTDTHRILVSQNETLTSFKDKQQTVRDQNLNKWKICPGDRPYTQNREFCFNCVQNSPYFNYTVKQCQSCPDHYVFDAQKVRCVEQFFITLINSDTQPRMLGYDNYTMDKYRTEQQQFKKSHPFVICNQSEPFGSPTGCKQCYQPTLYFDIKKKDCSDVKYLINFQKISPEYILPKDRNLDSYIAEQQKYRKQALFLTKKCADNSPYNSDRRSCFNCSNGEYFNFASKRCQKCPDNQAYSKNSKSCEKLYYLSKVTPVTQVNMKGYVNYTLEDYKKQQQEIKNKFTYQQCPDNAPYGTIDGCQQCQQPTPYFDIKKKVCSNAKKLTNFTAIGQNYTLGDGKTLVSYQQTQKNYKTYSESLTVECQKQTPFTSDRDYCFVCKQPDYLFNFQTKKCQSCPRGSTFSSNKKKCLRLFYLTNINTESQKKMVGTEDYAIADFKTDEEKLRKQNPYQNCTTQDPYGTLDGCRKCLAPEQYFDIKNKICTAVKKLINFDVIDKNIILKEGKPLSDYKKEQDKFQASSELSTVVCPATAPYTLNRDECFACKDPEILFDLETKTCKKCGTSQVYDPIRKKCIVKQIFTLFSTATEKFFMQTDDFTIVKYKQEQNKIKNSAGSTSCTAQRPYAGDSQCIQCNSTQPYFNIKLKKCEACDPGKRFFQSLHKCLLAAYMTDFTNKNIKQTSDLKVADAKKVEDNRAATPGYTAVKCPSDKPYSITTQCIACNNTKTPYFNIKTLSCEGCRQFYQYFQGNECKNNTILTNTKQMMGYIETKNFTKYNAEKQNNYTFILKSPRVVDCPASSPFYFRAQDVCVACNQPSNPIFSLEQEKCINVNYAIKESNPSAVKFYIEKDGYSLSDIKSEIQYLKKKGIQVQLCPPEKPYLSHNQCIICPQTEKYFDLSIEMCRTCSKGEKCVSA